MSPSPSSSPAIILVRPQLGENIGACARVMCNFNLSDLRIIAPRDGWPNDKAIDMAKSAKHIIEQATIYNTVEEALGDIHFLYATTVRPRYMVKPVYTPKKAIEDIYSHTNNKSAILFGPERSGLSNDEIALANAIITVPVGSEYDSLNLAQAVAIIAYEYFVYRQDYTKEHLPLGNTQLANRKEIALLLGHLEEELDKSGFFYVKAKREHMSRNIRNLFARTTLTEQDVRTLRGIIRSLIGATKNSD
jgi:tRNA/rRNA methyltransferase